MPAQAIDMTAIDVTSEPLKTKPVPQILAHKVPRKRAGWIDWLTTTDHKKIGIMYIVAAFIFFLLGGVEALLIRTQLSVPDNTLISPAVYNQILTIHGTTMTFSFVVPMMAGFANYFLPLMLGARDVAFPRLNALSLWMFIAAGVVLYASFFFQPPDAGWTMYTPLSGKDFSQSGGTDAWIFFVHLIGVSSIIGSINFFVTILNMRAKGMSWSRVPVFAWTILVFAILQIVSLPVLAGAVTMLLTDRHFGTHFFDPAAGGDTLLWQHLFWFLGHPEVYIIILPGFGIVSEILPVFARKPIFGYKAIVGASLAIGIISVMVWFHHMFTTPAPKLVMIIFMLTTMVVAIPTGVKMFNWVATLWRGSIILQTPLLYVIGFLTVFLIGGIGGVFLSIFPVDWQLHDSYFVVAHFHYQMVGGAMFSVFAGIYYWFPKMTGRLLSDTVGKISFGLMFVGFNVTFLIQHSAGLSGMPRRIYEYGAETGWQGYNLTSTIGSYILSVGILVSMANFLYSFKKGKQSGPDPWRGNTLEWFTQSPPPENNFDVIPPVRSVEPMKDIRRQIAEQTGEPVDSPLVMHNAE